MDSSPRPWSTGRTGFGRPGLMFGSGNSRHLPRRLLLPPLRLFVVLALTAGVVNAQAQPPNSDGEVAGRAVIAEADQALHRGDARGAIRSLTGWLAQHPHDTEVRIALGAVFQSMGELGRAETAYQAALNDDPRSAAALTALGSLREQQGHLSEAEKLFARAAKLRPDSQPVRLEWASVLGRLHRYQEAAAALAGVPPPESPAERIAYEQLKASIDLGRGDAKAAARNMERALKLAPGDPQLLLAAGMAENEAGDWREAMAHLRPVFDATLNAAAGLALLRAELAVQADHSYTFKRLEFLDLPPDQREGFYTQLGAMLSAAGFHGECAEVLKKAVENDPGKADLYYDLALAQFRAGQLDGALESAGRSRSLHDGAALEGLIGDIQEARGSSLEAVHSYQAAVALAPDQEQYHLALGFELLRHATFEPALTVFERAAERFPKSSRAQTAVGLTHYFLEQYPEAVRALLEASRIDPKSELAVDYLGEIQLQQPVTPDPAAIDQICRYPRAHPGSGAAEAYCAALRLRVEHDRGAAGPSVDVMQDLRLAARKAPDDATARCSLGQALEWSRQWQEAENEMEACLRLRPDSVEGHYRMANIARHLGQTERAEQEVRLHDKVQQSLVDANAERDRTIQKFLYTMAGSSSKDDHQP